VREYSVRHPVLRSSSGRAPKLLQDPEYDVYFSLWIEAIEHWRVQQTVAHILILSYNQVYREEVVYSKSEKRWHESSISDC